MGVADIFNIKDKAELKAMIESALFRSAGVGLGSYAYGPATNPDPKAGFRNYVKSGKGVGHVYVHVDGSGNDLTGHGLGLGHKSRYADMDTALNAMVEAFGNKAVESALQRLDANGGSQEWLHGASGVPITSGLWFGYPQGSTGKQKITKISLNMRSHGDALFISSSYPEAFTTV